MPAATPIPRGPAVLTLYTAADLLTGPGCPVCRYTDETADRYRAWFALEGHADAVTITRLCASLGMCPRHTRGLMGQPGAARRLTALYRYLVRAARDCLVGRAARSAGCPACEHDDGAVSRALETLFDGLADDRMRDRCREFGGLCIPHLRAAPARGKRQVIDWLAQTMTAAIAAGPEGTSWLAGAGHDAGPRAVLRDPPSAPALPGPGRCVACQAARRSEQARLAGMAAGRDSGRPDGRLLLCADHLGCLIAQARWPGAEPLLAWQADCLAAALIQPVRSPGRRATPAGWLRLRSRYRSVLDDCPVCLSSAAAAHRAVDDLRTWLRAAPPVRDRQVPLCVRHLLGLQAADPWAGQVTAPGAIQHADLLIAELDQAFANGTWAHRHEGRGPEMTAWRRAAVFLDGGVSRSGPGPSRRP